MSVSFCKGLVKIQLILDLDVGEPNLCSGIGSAKEPVSARTMSH